MMSYFVILFLCISQLVFGSSAMEYFASDATERFVEEEAEITLLNWNILGLPNDQVAVRPWEERVDAIAEKILLIDADLVILQECFEPQLSLALRDRLRKSYAHSYLHLEESSTPLTSGLALFSKLPVDDFRFIPHPDLLDTERDFKMGTIEFVLLNTSHLPVAHIAASHFQGSSNCEWRVGLTEDGKRLSYAEVRQQEAGHILSLFSPHKIPHYVCGDLNVDRRSTEYDQSILNELNNGRLVNAMSVSMKSRGTNTNFWKHEKGIATLYPDSTPTETLQLALQYQQFYEEKLKSALSKDPWNRTLSEFDPSYFSQLEKELDVKSEELMIWEYFKLASIAAIVRENELWKMNRNEGNAPPVSIGRVIEIRALPIEESLDYVLGTNEMSVIQSIEILEGYDDRSVQNTLSDHHPVLATIRVAQAIS